MNKNFDWAILIIVVINPELLVLPTLIFNIILKQKLEKIFVVFFNTALFSLWNCDLSCPWNHRLIIYRSLEKWNLCLASLRFFRCTMTCYQIYSFSEGVAFHGSRYRCIDLIEHLYWGKTLIGQVDSCIKHNLFSCPISCIYLHIIPYLRIVLFQNNA